MSAKRLRMSLSCRIQAVELRALHPALETGLLVLIPAGMYHTALCQASDEGKLVGCKEKVKEVLDIASNGM
ncbi:hypothetical protein G6L28_07300 [Agrobacterium larrymoorei]|uniref:hypothetical protein n=1 Tax=Agrobacterium larrymoorei TaxID=160699 RepID=UPI0015724A61|nr:hypothetical protein [Agrobacterium larrymoorei]NTJ42405.1 hypothetical protein [Agrobacterium larrymoorei]